MSLTKEQIKENWDIIKRKIDDDTLVVEYKSIDDNWYFSFNEIPNIMGFSGRYELRIKPVKQPKTRLLNQDDIILGKSVIRWNYDSGYQDFLILKTYKNGVTANINADKIERITWGQLKDEYLINHNNGIGDFLPCEVEVTDDRAE